MCGEAWLDRRIIRICKRSVLHHPQYTQSYQLQPRVLHHQLSSPRLGSRRSVGPAFACSPLLITPLQPLAQASGCSRRPGRRNILQYYRRPASRGGGCATQPAKTREHVDILLTGEVWHSRGSKTWKQAVSLVRFRHNRLPLADNPIFYFIPPYEHMLREPGPSSALSRLFSTRNSMRLSRSHGPRSASDTTSNRPSISHPFALSPNTSTTERSGGAHPEFTFTPPPVASPIPVPLYRPSSAPDFLERLSTFKLSTYRDKPAAIDAVSAARCGWRNEGGKDRLACNVCGAAWIVGNTTGMTREAGETCYSSHSALVS